MSRILLTLMLILSAVYSDSKHSLGVGASITNATTYTIKQESMYDFTLKYDYLLFKWLDIEARGSFYIADGKKLYHPVTLGIFLKPNFNFSDRYNFYALAGYSKNTLSKQDTSQINAVTIQNDVSYGGGVEYNLLDNSWLFLDYVRYVNKSTEKPEGTYAIKIDTITFGFNYRFDFNYKKETTKTKDEITDKVHLKAITRKVRYQKPVFSEFQIFDDMEEE